MPCSYCRKDPSLVQRGLPQEGHLWSTDEVINALRGNQYSERKEQTHGYLEVMVPENVLSEGEEYEITHLDPEYGFYDGTYNLVMSGERREVEVAGRSLIYKSKDVYLVSQDGQICIGIFDGQMRLLGGN